MWTKQNMPDLSGKTALVTGANTGIGYETALALYEAGAHVILACRSQENADKAMAAILQSGGSGSLETGLLDLADLNAVKTFADGIRARHKELHLLINNAGVMTPPAAKTADGFELQFGVNVLGHYALTGYLYPLLQRTPESRIITVSSLAYLRGAIDFDNLKSEKDYDAMREYAQSKLGNVLFSLELQRRIEQTHGQTISIAVQPGANKTDLARHMTDAAYAAARERVGELMEPWQGALPSLYAATDPNAKAGALYGPDKDGGYRGYPAEAIIAANATDETVAKQLWAYAEAATGVVFPFTD